MLLPFLASRRQLSVSMARDHAVRYLVPFCFAVVGYAAMFRLFVAPEMTTGAWLEGIAKAAIFADPWTLHTSTGFIVLWFLPALLAMVLLLAAYDSLTIPWRVTIVAVALVVHLGVGSLPVPVKSMVPQGLLIALYIFPLGLVARHVVPWSLNRNHQVWTAAIAAAVLLACWRYERGIEIEVATLVVPTALQPIRVAATDLSNLTFLILLFSCSGILAYIPGLGRLGMNSLLVCLIHPIAYKPILTILGYYSSHLQLGTASGAITYWLIAASSVLTVVVLSLSVAFAITTYTPLRRLLIPHMLQDWLPVAMFNTQGRCHSRLRP
jgi:hypothetical protein